ncbi:MAG: glycosyltransferase family 39 protein [Deltaproteobacteria bacterium]|nr:glycosyltransferase family 39 protein [Deltaproteobacteria bacterium]
MDGAGARWLRKPSVWIFAITLFAALVRLTNIDFDQHHFFHPDERRIAYAIGDLSFQPLQLNPKFFAYGSFPIYIDKAANSLLGLIDQRWLGYDSAIHTSRAVSGVMGTLTVLLVILLGFRLYDRPTGLLAGFLLAACVLHVQNSHYGTVDITLTFLVLLALYRLTHVVQRGWTRDYLIAGLIIGFAGATKASAFPIMLPLGIAAVSRIMKGDRLVPVLLRVVGATILVGVAFAIGQPYAILDFKDFTHDLLEQSGMVRNAGQFPYTNQYVGTPKYGYELIQMILCGMAPPLALAAIWASGRHVAGVWRERAEEIVLLAWVVPFFLVTGWFEVKFIRYLLPIYPLMILWAAEWLLRVYRRGGIGRVALPTVVVGTTAALLAFLAIYSRPHTVVAGSEWVYKFIPAGSRILSQDWDEGFPMPLPGGFNPERYKIVNFGYYEPDNPAKMAKLAKELADAEYIAFQTKRLYGATTQAAQKFPLTSNYFYLLFAGDLGYTLTYEEAARPNLFGLEFPDEIVDESFTVYDHPKVLIFRNEGHLSADAILDKILHGLPSRQMTRNELLLARPGEATAGVASEPIHSSLPALFTFALLIEALALATYPLTRRWLAGASPYALAKVLGVLVFAYVPWLLVSLGQADFTRSTLATTALLMGGLGLMSWLRARRTATPSDDIDRDNASQWIAVEALFWGTFLFFLIVRSFNPEIFWGEKPMDFSFLNALTRATTLPPPEPWFAGHDLNYSYFGHFISAALGKVCHIDPAITFNLAIAFFGGLTAVAAFALGHAITKRWQTGVLAGILTVLLGNLSGPREYYTRGVMNFDYFWATSRVIKDTINEFPLWSFLFADLHAHVMVMPFSLTFLCLVVAWVRRRFGEPDGAPSSRTALTLLLGLALGTVMVSNGWSSPTYVLVFPFLLACHWIGASSGRRFFTFIGQFFTRVLTPAVLVVIVAYAFYLPFWFHFTPPERNIGWEVGPYARPRDFLQIFGLFLYILIPFFFANWRRVLMPQPRPVAATQPPPMAVEIDPAPAAETADDEANAPGAMAVAENAWIESPPEVVPIVIPPLPPAAPRLGTELRLGWFRIAVIGLVIVGAIASLFISTRAFELIIAMLGLHLALHPRTDAHHRVPIALAAFACFITAGCEIVFVWDRMNTIFKFYLDSWLIFSGAAAAAVAELWSGRVLSGVARRVWQAGLVVLVAVAVFTSVSGTYGVLTTNRVKTPKPTLNGTLYLDEHDPYEVASYKWLNERISGIPVIVEAFGPSYQEFSRVSMNTGLPTVLGWEYHVIQRAATQPDVNRRKNDIKLIYTSDNKDQVRAALERYHVAMVYVGPLERRTYNGANTEQFKTWSNLLTPVYENSAVSIYAVSGNFTGAIPVTTVEEVPRVTADEAPAPAPEPEGQLHQPRGVAVDSTGAVYACDFGNARIQKFNKDLKFDLAWGEHGELPSQFKDPCGIAVGPKNNVFVADTWNHRVQVFTDKGQYVREWGSGFYGPRGIAIDGSGAVFVADTGNNRIMRFSPTGELEATWGAHGSEDGKFFEPTGIAVDGKGKVYVCDNGNGRLQIFSRDGAFVSSFPVPGWLSQVYAEPYVAIDSKGAIWVTVSGAKEVRAYDTSGKLLRTITGKTIPTAQFETPMGIAFNPVTKEMVVSDLEHKLVRFAYGEGR